MITHIEESFVRCLRTLSILSLLFFSLATDLAAEEPPTISDNSFLIEEAYNQEPGVVQHINVLQYDWKADTWAYSFTQEWPLFSQSHQLSYTIPVLRVDDPESDEDIGDFALNYRYQLLNGENLSVSPRFSLLLPTGDEDQGFGNGAVGYQVNLPVSLILSKDFVYHWNFGYTVTPNAEDGSGAEETIDGFNYGASFVWLAAPTFNLLLETVGTASDVVGDGGQEDTLFINPGARFAINFESGLQIVPGISFPIGVGPSSDEYQVLFYLSFEHPY